MCLLFITKQAPQAPRRAKPSPTAWARLLHASAVLIVGHRSGGLTRSILHVGKTRLCETPKKPALNPQVKTGQEQRSSKGGEVKQGRLL